MKPETKQLARGIFATIMNNATGLDSVSRELLFKEAAVICFEAASAFEAVESEIL